MNFKPRRFLNALAGCGPWRVESFDGIVGRRSRLDGPLHQPEQEQGAIQVVAPELVRYPALRPLSGRPLEFERLKCGLRYADGLAAVLPGRRLYLLEDAGVVGNEGLVYDVRRRCAVLETARRWHCRAGDLPALEAVGLPRPEQLPGRSLVLATPGGEGFYHLLLELCPRLALARGLLDQVDQVLVCGHPSSLPAAWLEELGIPGHKIRWLSGLSHYRCETVVFTDAPMPDQQPGPWLVAALRGLFGHAPSRQGGRSLWISRRSASSRHPVWEEELLSHLGPIECVRLEELTPARQRRLFAEASSVIAPHGAGLSNLVFSSPGIRVVELFPTGRPAQPVYSRLCSLVGGLHACATLDFTSPPAASEMEELTQGIRSFLAETNEGGGRG